MLSGPSWGKDENRFARYLRGSLAELVESVLHEKEIADGVRAAKLNAGEVIAAIVDSRTSLAWVGAVVKTVLDHDEHLEYHDAGKPPRWERGWTASKRQVVNWFLAIGLPVVSFLLVTSLWPALASSVKVVAVGFFVASLVMAVVLFRKSVPETTWEWCCWAVQRAVLRLQITLHETDWRHSVRQSIVLPAVRQLINERIEPSFGMRLSVYDSGDFRSRNDVSSSIRTESVTRFLRVVGRSDGGSIALAGPRGAGKTTIINCVRDGVFTSPGVPGPLTIVASAPARYDARDFVLHLHATLCRAVIAHTTDSRSPAHRGFHEHWTALEHRLQLHTRLRASARGAAKILFSAALIALVGLWAWQADPAAIERDIRALVEVYRTKPADEALEYFRNLPSARGPALMAALVMVAVVVAKTLGGLLAVAATLWRMGSRFRAQFNDPSLRMLRVFAQRHLGQIRFLQTHTTGWSGKLGLPLKAESSWSKSVQRAEQQLTHPEVVEEFRHFLERTVQTLRGAGIADGVVIAIDELDKMATADQAHEFVNEIKGVFGVPHCLFVVSVSEDAIVSFERRGMPVRDAFDSAFTEFVHVDYFSLDETRVWLRRRAIGLPEPFVGLCHCLSGGLPRDLGRVAFAMMDQVTSLSARPLQEVTHALVGEELRRKVRAFTGAMTSAEEDDDVADFVAALHSITAETPPTRLLEIIGRLSPLAAGTQTASSHRALRWETVCFLLFCVTVLEVFNDALSVERLVDALSEDAGEGSLAALARARQQMAIHPKVAWALLRDFRAYWGLLSAGGDDVDIRR